MVLVDTSAWILVFRRQPRTRLVDDTVDFDDVVTCLPVVQEVLQGFRDETACARARDAMLALPIVDSPMPSNVTVATTMPSRDLAAACPAHEGALNRR